MRGIMLLILLVTFTGCDLRQRELAMEKREAEIAEREQQLALREKSIEVRELQMLEKERKFDSTSRDSAITFNPALPGQWAAKMVCSETTCTGSAVGDTRNETWTFNYENNKLIVQALSGDKLVRVYTGTYTNNVIELVENVEPTATAPATKMVVRITVINNNSMEGIREIVRPDCRIVYSLQLSKQ
ncbi:hypothetical protein [Aridibaculum aurantiacum]|uniref:hypothetical protein n=1 Tax=Aridibaculum aurantiacum TaxID=2810307 RepID=UPI001A9722CC|nr:hypothetical protein [Aridibaculum aurantiacum]